MYINRDVTFITLGETKIIIKIKLLVSWSTCVFTDSLPFQLYRISAELDSKNLLHKL
jgi:hypothetical protein